jgi:hypothetical protein
MDERKLRARLHRADLRLGDVAQTVRELMSSDFAPIGFVANDLDLYTSTRDSLAIFEAKPERLLPRVTMYFDDLFGYPYTPRAASGRRSTSSTRPTALLAERRPSGTSGSLHQLADIGQTRANFLRGFAARRDSPGVYSCPAAFGARYGERRLAGSPGSG